VANFYRVMSESAQERYTRLEQEERDPNKRVEVMGKLSIDSGDRGEAMWQGTDRLSHKEKNPLKISRYTEAGERPIAG